MSRRLLRVLVMSLALLALGAPALAKEGATTKFDSLPTQWYAGQSYTLGYTILMDGVEPYKADRTAITATSLDGKTELIFPGTPDGKPGHYTATVLFPASGPYHWKVTQGSFFPAHDLGTVSVLPALGTSSASTPPAADPLRDAAPFATAGAALVALALIARTQRRRLLRTA